MDEYTWRVNRAIKDFTNRRAGSVAQLAKALGYTSGTFYAKLSGHRTWTVRDLQVLARCGVSIPAFDGDVFKKGYRR